VTDSPGYQDNEGHPGAWVHQVREKLPNVANLKPNLVLINAGT
jgi:PhoPQ-activated pathogenicity-related protein